MTDTKKRDTPAIKKILSSKALRIVCLIVYDALALAFAEMFSLFLREDLNVNSADFSVEFANLIQYLPVAVLLTVVIFALLRIYDSLWQFASIYEYSLILLGTTIAFVINTVLRTVLDLKLPRSCYPMIWMLFTFETVGIRVLYRVVRSGRKKNSGKKTTKCNVMLIGAGYAANILLKEFNTSTLHNKKKVVCIIDDALEKKGLRMGGVRIVGTRNDIPEMVKKYEVDEIIFAIPSLDSKEKAKILGICKKTRCSLKTLPGISQYVNNEIRLSSLESIDVNDFLGREPIKADIDSIIGYIEGKVIIVTGGGGSIGSELCRQIACHKPKRLIIFDIYENNAYDIQNELKSVHPDLDLVTLIGSVRDEHRVDQVFEKYRPEIVFHAAAHKHVPLMEDSPNEAVKNNVFGTLALARAADAYGVSRFILISTDKAVNPTNIMGATKRICEMIIQSQNKRSKTEFVAVRFGNVLGSNGSVIPLFKKQIAEGGPVTVTDPNIIRFFMTIPEAVGLVLKAGALAHGGEIFVLDMGQPVKILDLAENLIRLSGHIPYTDIDIVFTGLRPGEKLYEEILLDEEGIRSTSDEKIYIGHPLDFDTDEFEASLARLHEIMNDDSCDMKAEINKIVPIKGYKAHTEISARI